MSRTLTLIPTGWELVRATAERGGRASALVQLERVLARPDVPAALVADGHRLAAELALDLSQYATARRHLKAVVELEPGDAGARFLLGRAWEEDPDGCDRRAAIAFKKATALDPANALSRACFGRAAERCGSVKRGTREMLAAVAAAAGDVAVVRVAVQGLLEVGKVADARQVIARARFLCPGNGELTALWQRVNFEDARRTQRKLVKAEKSNKAERTSGKTRYAQDAHFATDGDRVTLPFVRPTGAPGNGGTVRHDGPSFPRPHIARLHTRKADR